MIIRFTKGIGKPNVLTCVRDDKTVTTFTAPNATEFFVLHDLTHYAVETVLGYKYAFYGIVSEGRDIQDFGTQHGRKDERPYTPQAGYAEHIVGLIQNSSWGELTFPSFREMLKLVYSRANAVPPQVTETQFRDITVLMRSLIQQWKLLEEGEVLELPFPAA